MVRAEQNAKAIKSIFRAIANSYLIIFGCRLNVLIAAPSVFQLTGFEQKHSQPQAKKTNPYWLLIAQSILFCCPCHSKWNIYIFARRIIFIAHAVLILFHDTCNTRFVTSIQLNSQTNNKHHYRIYQLKKQPRTAHQFSPVPASLTQAEMIYLCVLRFHQMVAECNYQIIS